MTLVLMEHVVVEKRCLVEKQAKMAVLEMMKRILAPLILKDM